MNALDRGIVRNQRFCPLKRDAGRNDNTGTDVIGNKSNIQTAKSSLVEDVRTNQEDPPLDVETDTHAVPVGGDFFNTTS